MTVLQFPRKVGTNDLSEVAGGVWTCGCGCQHWILYANGICLCPECNCISTVIQNSQAPLQAPPNAAGPDPSPIDVEPA
jgi:hypothetical protein